MNEEQFWVDEYVYLLNKLYTIEGWENLCPEEYEEEKDGNNRESDKVR